MGWGKVSAKWEALLCKCSFATQNQQKVKMVTLQLFNGLREVKNNIRKEWMCYGREFRVSTILTIIDGSLFIGHISLFFLYKCEGRIPTLPKGLCLPGLQKARNLI